MILLHTAMSVDLDAKAYLPDVLVRIGHEPDVKKLTPHGWKQHFEAEVTARRDEILQRSSGELITWR